MNHRLYGRVVTCDRRLEFHETHLPADLQVVSGHVAAGTSCFHDVPDPGRDRRLRIWDATTQPVVEYDGWRFGLSTSRVTYTSVGEHDSPFDLVLERVVVPLARLLLEHETIALHGSSVIVEAAAIALIGPSGAGKSTTARLLADNGAFASDDLTLIDGDSLVQPSAAGLRSWEPLNGLGRELYTGSEKLWYALPEPPPPAAPLGLVLHLRRADIWSVERLSGTKAVVRLLENAFDLESPPEPWRKRRLTLASQLARQVPIIEVVYPADAGVPSHGEPLWDRVKHFLGE